MKTRIVFIDNDIKTLETYEAAFASRSDQWETEGFTDAAPALESIEAKAPDIVVASYRLTNNDGIDLLKQIELLQPEAQLFITATDDDKEKIESGLGSNYQYLPKPCSADRLITEFQRCLAIDTWLGNERVKKLVSKMGEFPSLPPMYLKVVNALNSRDASTEQIGQAISGDIAISAKLLQVVNSSYYGFEDKISDISQAVTILGIESVKHLVLAIQVFGRLGRSPDQKAITDQLWHHSMSVAVAAKRIMRYESGDDKLTEEAYTAGLLHDLGKLVMINAAPDEFAKAREMANERQIPLWQAEDEIIGCNHAETGAYLLGRWGMPASVVEAVALHHQPMNTSGTRFSTLSAVHVANALVWERRPGDTPHPDAKPDQNFLAEIGKATSWQTWQDVVTGKITDAARLASSSKEANDPAPTAEAAKALKGVAAVQPKGETPNPDTPDSSATESSKQSSPAKRMSAITATAIAACLGIAAGAYFLATQNRENDAFDEDETREFRRVTSDAHEPEDLFIATENTGDAIAIDLQPAEEEVVESVTDAISVEELVSENEYEEEAFDIDSVEIAEKVPASTEPVAEPPSSEEEIEQDDATILAAADSTSPQPILPSPEQSFPDITLSGIFYSSDNPLASVNGKIRRVGDSVSGAEIVSIERKRIVLRFDDQIKDFPLR